jgi:uncharacterized cupin superfamily protein
MRGAMRSRILNLGKVTFQDWGNGEGFEAKIAWVGARIGSGKLGFNVTVIAPGKAAFPYHSHATNEEMFFVLEGRGRIRIGDRFYPIRAGDFISMPPGREYAHQISNNSKAPLKFLAVSTMQIPEVSEYPDSNKLGVFAGTPTGRPPAAGAIRKLFRASDDVNYWEGEAYVPNHKRKIPSG